jgi:hypothetical protein
MPASKAPMALSGTVTWIESGGETGPTIRRAFLHGDKLLIIELEWAALYSIRMERKGDYFEGKWVLEGDGGEGTVSGRFFASGQGYFFFGRWFEDGDTYFWWAELSRA